MRFHIHLGAAAAAAVLLLTGCGQPEAPDPPLAQAELMNRLLSALQARRIDEALKLTEKMQSLDPDNIAFAELRNRLIGNLYAQRCSTLLQTRGVDAALAEIRRGRGKYPVHLRLRFIEQQLLQLKTLAKAAAALRNAKDDKALTAALTAIAPLVKDYPEAQQLRKDIADRRKDLMNMREAARRKAEEEARRKAEEEARKKAEEAAARLQTETAPGAGQTKTAVAPGAGTSTAIEPAVPPSGPVPADGSKR